MIISKRRERFQFSKRQKAGIILAIILGGFLGPYVGTFLYAMDEYNYNAYNLPAPDQSTFVYANNSRLYSMAMWFEQNIATYHMPHDMIVNTRFKTASKPSGIADIVSHSVSYDSAEWTGHYLMAQAYRYLVHLRDDKPADAAHALDRIEQVLRGYNKIIHVSGNGGMARYAWPANEYPGDPYNIQNDNHYLRTWNGSDYVLEDDTSRDMHNGVIMGLGFTYLLVNDTDVRATAKRLVEDLLDYFIDTGWLYLKPTDDPNGTDFAPNIYLAGTAGIWTLAWLKVGALVNPEKYSSTYDYYAVELDFAHRSAAPLMSRTNLVQSYYGLLLDWELLFLILMLEDDTSLRSIYLNYIKTAIRDPTKNYRDPMFKAFWLMVNGINKENAGAEDAVDILDIEDCLMRYYDNENRLPGRYINMNINVTNPGVVDPVSVKWYNFFNYEVGAILYPFWFEVYHFSIITKRPLTPDYRPATDFLWSRCPYDYKQTGDGTNEGAGTDFIAVYWPCRYYNIISAPSDYDAKIKVTYPGG